MPADDWQVPFTAIIRFRTNAGVATFVCESQEQIDKALSEFQSVYDNLQARALAAERERDALSLEYAKYRQDAAAERDELRAQFDAAEGLVEALGYDSDAVAALVRAARALHDAADALTFAVEPPQATEECLQWKAKETEDAVEALATLLDAPPWRDLR